VGNLYFLLVFQLGERGRLFMLVEVGVRRILILLLLLLFRNYRLHEGSMTLLLSDDAHLIVLTAD